SPAFTQLDPRFGRTEGGRPTGHGKWRAFKQTGDHMWPSNPLTERLNLKFPIILAPMGIITTPALAAAVSNAGGLGGIGMWGLTAEEAARPLLASASRAQAVSTSTILCGRNLAIPRKPARRCVTICRRTTMPRGW